MTREQQDYAAAGMPEHAYIAGVKDTSDECTYCHEALYVDSDGAFVTRTQFGGFASGCSASFDQGGDGEHEPPALRGV